MQFTMDRQILQWLGSLGYEINDKSRARLVTIFIEEARQWELSPEELEAWIKQGEKNRKREEDMMVLPGWRPLISSAA